MKSDAALRGATRLRMMLAADVDAPAAARTALRSLGLGDTQHDVLLLASELVTNVVRHAGLGPGERLELLADCRADATRVEVRDDGIGFGDGDPREGFGFRIVAFAAERWGIEREGRTCVWFEVPSRRLRAV
jgi:anti-sigma regulatory factor (Ser/Thr protein kinase)